VVFTDNAALSNPPSALAGTNIYTQTILLNVAGSSSVLLSPPSATVTIPTINEPIMVIDTAQPNVPCQAVVTSSFSYQLGPIVAPPTSTYASRSITLTNTSGNTISGPLNLALSGLNGNVVAGAATVSGGRVTSFTKYSQTSVGCSLPAGLYFVSVPNTALIPSGTATVVLYFSDPSRAAVSFTPVLAAGSGAP